MKPLKGSKIMLKNPNTKEISIFKYYSWMSARSFFLFLYFLNILFLIGFITGFSVYLVIALAPGGEDSLWISVLIGIFFIFSFLVAIFGLFGIRYITLKKWRTKKQIMYLLIEGYIPIDEEKIKIIMSQHLGIPTLKNWNNLNVIEKNNFFL